MDFSLNSGESGLLLRSQSLGLVAKESEVIVQIIYILTIFWPTYSINTLEINVEVSNFSYGFAFLSFQFHKFLLRIF